MTRYNNARHRSRWRRMLLQSLRRDPRAKTEQKRASRNGVARSLLLTYHSQLFAHWTLCSQHFRADCSSSQVAAYRATASYSHGPSSMVIASPRLGSDLRLSCHAELHHTCSRGYKSLTVNKVTCRGVIWLPEIIAQRRWRMAWSRPQLGGTTSYRAPFISDPSFVYSFHRNFPNIYLMAFFFSIRTDFPEEEL